MKQIWGPLAFVSSIINCHNVLTPRTVQRKPQIKSITQQILHETWLRAVPWIRRFVTFLTAVGRVQFQANLGGITRGQTNTETGFPASTSVIPCQYHSTCVPRSLTRLPRTLHKISHWHRLQIRFLNQRKPCRTIFVSTVLYGVQQAKGRLVMYIWRYNYA